jgi:uncharacterized oxidoreductase
MKLEGRTVLITGGSSGIGFELAKQLIARRNTVVITGRNPLKLAEAKSSLPEVHTFQSDAGNPEEIQSLREHVLADFPALDTLINNAGIMRNLNLNTPRSLGDVTTELQINLSGPIQMVQEFLPHLKRRPNALLVNVTSGLAFVPFPLSPVYSAAKAGLHAFTRCLRVQLKGSQVSVVELAPPGVETKLFRAEFEKEMKNEKGMPVDVLVSKAIAGIEAGKLEVRPGLSNILYILSRLAPALPFGQMAKLIPNLA